MIFFNTQLIYLVYKNKNRSNLTTSNNKEIKMSITVITITILFILFTLPTASIQYNIVYKNLYSTELGQLCILLCNAVTYTYQASNFIILYLSNNQFSMELKSIIYRNKVSNSSIKTSTVITIHH